MHYFITTREDYQTSAIELAQVKRMEIFDALKVSNKIIEIEKNDFTQEAREKLKTRGRVINIFQYFQKLPGKLIMDTATLLKIILEKPGLTRQKENAYQDGKVVIQAHLYNDRLYYVDYLDHYGFTVKRQFYMNNHLNYTEYFDDKAHLMMREFVDVDNHPIIREYFCQSTQNKPLLTMIELERDHTLRFNDLPEFQGYFLDRIAQEDSEAVFYCDRCTQVLPAFKKMKKIVPSYVVFHSALTPSGDINDEAYTVYQPVTELAQVGKIRGLISSTTREAEDAKNKLEVSHSYAIPVTFIEKELSVTFDQRIAGKVIAVARVDAIKQLSHLIQAVISLKKNHPNLDLSIYGNNTDEPENKKLHEIVEANHAEDYIHFCGFAQDLDQVYNTAQLEVLTSKNEGFAMALLEAQAHGCPAVSYDINYGPADIIEDNVSGRLVKPNDQAELREVMNLLLTTPDILKQYSEGAYKTSIRFDFDHIKNKWQDFLENEKLV